ncbi:hypothetical protein AGABI1DRAFT_127295 [Agaricus bisporus var. burnettii JB137-S8]|uniref:Uncharacterized protein n=1 Tax=Agaricus bisporus var. burnettii (strain JB137-S8 / ATCC MYA-4627 / FGSC 10392) TaxID=597362 RepID=K5X0F3_AGABU|nr:uncharacterized protein AGABI1DRAFT_127295 [Agaricus bisporus var. burnettii JB137-S8]EKM81281.1 hypothetical protein AGABI1DRAFT_127295 [Agaricus bisporus var. burnettii JB137-S8]
MIPKTKTPEDEADTSVHVVPARHVLSFYTWKDSRFTAEAYQQLSEKIGLSFTPSYVRSTYQVPLRHLIHRHVSELSTPNRSSDWITPRHELASAVFVP